MLMLVLMEVCKYKRRPMRSFLKYISDMLITIIFKRQQRKSRWDEVLTANRWKYSMRSMTTKRWRCSRTAEKYRKTWLWNPIPGHGYWSYNKRVGVRGVCRTSVPLRGAQNLCRNRDVARKLVLFIYWLFGRLCRISGLNWIMQTPHWVHQSYFYHIPIISCTEVLFSSLF